MSGGSRPGRRRGLIASAGLASLLIALGACDFRAESDWVGVLFINELMPLNLTGASDELGEQDDWVELYNASEQAVSLDGFFLSDNPANVFKVRLSGALVVPAGGVLLLWADREPLQGPNHLPIGLSGVGESVVLSDRDGKLVDRYSWRRASGDEAFARHPDGLGAMVVCPGGSPGALNGLACASAASNGASTGGSDVF